MVDRLMDAIVEKENADDRARRTAATLEFMNARADLIRSLSQDGVEHLKYVATARESLLSANAALRCHESDIGRELSDDYELGRIEESRSFPSFRIRVGHIRQWATALKSLSPSPGGEGIRAAALALADAADDVGVKYFDTDTMSPEVEAMKKATLTLRSLLPHAGGEGEKG